MIRLAERGEYMWKRGDATLLECLHHFQDLVDELTTSLLRCFNNILRHVQTIFTRLFAFSEEFRKLIFKLKSPVFMNCVWLDVSEAFVLVR